MKYIRFVILLLILSSCENYFTLNNENEESKLVVNCILQQDSTIKIFLNKTRDLNTEIIVFEDTTANVIYNCSDLITNANVKVNEEILEINQKGVYVTDFEINTDKLYNLEVNCDGFITVKSSDIIPCSTRIKGLKYLGVVRVDENGNNLHGYNLSFEKNNTNKNFYKVRIKIGYYFCDGSLDIFKSSILTDNQNIKNYNNNNTRDYLLFSDDAFLNSNYNFDYLEYGQSNVVIVELYTLSENYFKFLESNEKRVGLSNGFSIETGFSGQTTPVTMYSNIENGYGIFAGYSVDIDTFYVEDCIPN